MLTIEHYNNLMNYIGYAEMSLDYMIEKLTQLMKACRDWMREMAVLRPAG